MIDLTDPKTRLEEIAIDLVGHYPDEQFAIKCFIIGFETARYMAYCAAVQWPNNPSLDTIEKLLKLGETPSGEQR